MNSNTNAQNNAKLNVGNFELDVEQLKYLDIPDLNMNDFSLDKNFDSGELSDQGQLDKKDPIICPGCGLEFNK